MSFASEHKRLALTRWCNVGPSGVGEDFPIADYSNANFISTALKSNDHSHGDFVKSVIEKQTNKTENNNYEFNFKLKVFA